MDSLTARKFRPPLGDATRFIDPENFPDPGRTAVRNAMARAQKALAEDYRGITAPGGAAPSGLFPIVKTGISVQPVIDAALAFATLLTPEQHQATSFSRLLKKYDF
jgi:hypothetical protein